MWPYYGLAVLSDSLLHTRVVIFLGRFVLFLKYFLNLSGRARRFKVETLYWRLTVC